MDSKTEPASEKEQAIWMANNLLDEPNADPDDDARTISRQFLRALEEITRLKAELERERQQLSEYKDIIKQLLPLAELHRLHLAWHNMMDDSNIAGKIVDRAKALLQESNQGQPLQE